MSDLYTYNGENGPVVNQINKDIILHSGVNAASKVLVMISLKRYATAVHVSMARITGLADTQSSTTNRGAIV